MTAADRQLTGDQREFLEQHSGLPADLWAATDTNAGVRRRTEEARASDYADTIRVDDAAARLGVSSAEVSQWLAAGRVARWDFGEEVRLPAWQFTVDGLVPHLTELLAILPRDLHPATIRGFVTTRHDDLDGMSVVEWLVRGGDVAAVAFAATELDHR